MAQSAFEDPDADLQSVLLPFDWPWDEGETIRPCRHCNPWYAELVLEPPDDAIWVREWHAEECRTWAEIEAAEA
jgi:hypothetical protein